MEQMKGLCLWHDGGSWGLAHSPTATLCASSAEALRELPARATHALQQGDAALAVGLLSYEAGEVLAGIRPATEGSCLAAVHLFAHATLLHGPLEDLLGSPAAQTSSCLDSPFVAEQDDPDYFRALARIHDYLLAGDCYQVNYARRFRAAFKRSALAAWARLASRHPAPHASFFSLPDGNAVFGVSPERFLEIRKGRVVTEPIKGSRPRGPSLELDDALGRELAGSEKDRAENLMIVDLLRNDLGKICRPGSVKTEELFTLKRFSNVQHLVSKVTGQLRDDVLPLEALLACFPGGSVTGAPKRRAMEIIRELEPRPRGFYCGSQFQLDAEGNLDSNILIRSFQQEGHQLFCHGGGGIVAGSDARAELAESEFKVRALMEALGS